MSFRDISRRSGSSKGSNKTTPPRKQLSERNDNAGIAVNGIGAQQQRSIQNSLNSSSNTAFSSQQYTESSYHSNPETIRDEEQLKLSQQREEDYALQLMREREQELQDINHKMHVVNEIYKDLGEVVDQQQEQIDNIEDQFGMAKDNARKGLEQLEKANSKGNKKCNRNNHEEAESDVEKQDECQFFLMKYVQKKMNSVRKMMSVCGGSATAEYSLGKDDDR